MGEYALSRAALRILIENQRRMKVVGEAANSTESLAKISEKPDVILIDVDSRWDVVRDLIPNVVAVANGAQVLILMNSHDPEVHCQAVRLGAMGVVPKGKPAEVLVKAIERVHAGELWIDRLAMPSLMRGVRGASAAAEAKKATTKLDGESLKIASLTKREREVIALLGSGFASRQIAERLFIAETTVRHHLTSIFDKLGVCDRFELVFYAYRHGLAIPPLSTVP